MTDIQALLRRWEDRSRSAFPADAMLINLHIRELRELDATAAPVVVTETGNPVSEQNQALTAPVVVGEEEKNGKVD